MSFSETYNPNAPQATTGVGAAVSNREDLTDVLSILAPEETPILSSASKQKANSTFVEWTVDKLADPITSGVEEGADISSFTDKFAGRARLGNYVQKFRRDYMVSDLQEAVESVGPAKIAQAEAKAIRELKRDIEATISANSGKTAEDGAGTPYALQGLGRWLAGGGTNDTTQDTNIPSDFRTPAANNHTNGNFTEATFNDQISSIFRETGNVDSLVLVADTNLRRDISDFARIGESNENRQFNVAGDSGSIRLSVDLYQSDHGVVSIVNANPSCFSAANIAVTTTGDAGYLVNPEYYGIHELIPMGSTRLPNLGGGERGFVDCALTLAVYHPRAHGKITDLD
tara:strand:+ start:5770 stop:6798 length:1029 start_codon:yes stop_codon:yes gene_type:complete